MTKDPKLPAGDIFSQKRKNPRNESVRHGMAVARAELRGDTSIDDEGGFLEYIRRRNPTLLNYEHVPKLADVGERVVRGELKHTMVILPPRHFKALADDTPISTPLGWRALGDLEVGDEVFDPDQNPTKVLAVRDFDRPRPLYRVTTTDGASVLADAEHGWRIRISGESEWRLVETRELAALVAGSARVALPSYGYRWDDTSRWLRSVHHTGVEGAVRCIQVDRDDGLFLAGYGSLTTHNSEIFSRLLPGYFLRQRPDLKTAIVSYAAELAWDLSAEARNHYEADGGSLAKDTAAKKRWKTDVGGELWAAGVGGPMLGFGYHCFAADTLVATEDGEVDITDLCKIDDPPRVLTFNHNTHVLEYQRVRATSVREARGLVNVMVGDRSVRCTPDHLFYVPERGYVRAKTLTAGTTVICQSEDGNPWRLGEVERVVHFSDSEALVYDLQVAGNKNFFAEGVLVHNCGIIDDPTDPEKATSPAYQRRFRDWFPGKFLSRRDPGARIVFVMQRLGVDDPVDFLLRREVGDETDLAPLHWHVVFFDEIKSDEPIAAYDGPLGLPSTCTLETDDRDVGEVIAPSLWAPDEVRTNQIIAGPYVAQTQRQGRPMEPSGDFWQKDWFRTYTDLPDDAHNGGWDWDTAFTKDEANAASAGIKSYRGKGKPNECPIYIDDVDWDWLDFPELVEKINTTAGPHYIEAQASGKSARQALEKQGIAVDEVTVPGDKFSRATAIQAVVSNKRVWVNKRIRAALLSDAKQGLLRITAERLTTSKPKNLDVNDAFVQALHRHTGGRSWERPRGARLGSVTKSGNDTDETDVTDGMGRGRIRVGFTGQ